MTRGELSAKFRKEVYDRADDVDPDSVLDWFSLAVGFAIANGVDPDEAQMWASQARYSEHIA